MCHKYPKSHEIAHMLSERNISSDLDMVYESTDLQASWWECIIENHFSYFSTKTYVVGTQKNRYNETVLLST